MFVISMLLLAGCLAWYLIWPSRWNIPAHLQFAFGVAAYLFPPLDPAYSYSIELFSITEKYSAILAVGLLFQLLGLYFSHQLLARVRFVDRRLAALPLVLSREDYVELVGRRILYILLIGVVLVGLSYIVMGFTPMFADDPDSARFFKGEYRASYNKVVVPYRLGQFILAALVGPAIVVSVAAKRPLLFFVAFIGAIELLLSLSRFSLAYSFLTSLGVVLCSSRRGAVTYALLAIALYLFGAASYVIFALISGAREGYDTHGMQLFIRLVSQGAPDIKDQALALRSFLDQGEPFTYGRTVFGGMVPFRFYWNPSNWSLALVNVGADLSEIKSGGLRFPAPLWGYFNFGMFGVGLISFFSGVFISVGVNFLRRSFIKADIVQKVVALMIFMSLHAQLIAFYRLSFYSFPGIAISVYLMFVLTVSPTGFRYFSCANK